MLDKEVIISKIKEINSIIKSIIAIIILLIISLMILLIEAISIF